MRIYGYSRPHPYCGWFGNSRDYGIIIAKDKTDARMLKEQYNLTSMWEIKRLDVKLNKEPRLLDYPYSMVSIHGYAEDGMSEVCFKLSYMTNGKEFTEYIKSLDYASVRYYELKNSHTIDNLNVEKIQVNYKMNCYVSDERKKEFLKLFE